MVTNSKSVILPATDEHKAAEAVKENVVEATADKDGSYESVIYCADCGEELSRETVVVPATGASTEAPSTDAPSTDAPSTNAPATGDNVMLWVVLCVVSAMGIVAVSVFRKKSFTK